MSLFHDVILDLFDDMCGHTASHTIIRNIFRYNGTCCNHNIIAYCYAREYRISFYPIYLLANLYITFVFRYYALRDHILFFSMPDVICDNFCANPMAVKTPGAENMFQGKSFTKRMTRLYALQRESDYNCFMK